MDEFLPAGLPVLYARETASIDLRHVAELDPCPLELRMVGSQAIFFRIWGQASDSHPCSLAPRLLWEEETNWAAGRGAGPVGGGGH